MGRAWRLADLRRGACVAKHGDCAPSCAPGRCVGAVPASWFAGGVCASLLGWAQGHKRFTATCAGCCVPVPGVLIVAAARQHWHRQLGVSRRFSALSRGDDVQERQCWRCRRRPCRLRRGRPLPCVTSNDSVGGLRLVAAAYAELLRCCAPTLPACMLQEAGPLAACACAFLPRLAGTFRLLRNFLLTFYVFVPQSPHLAEVERLALEKCFDRCEVCSTNRQGRRRHQLRSTCLFN